MKRRLTLILLACISFVACFAQDRMEFLETNVPVVEIDKYADSYLWTKNWWLTSDKMIEPSGGGNALSPNSPLNKQNVDSLSKEFLKYFTVDLIRFGNFQTRVRYVTVKRPRPYILATLYENCNQKPKLIGQYLIEFDKGVHKDKADVFTIAIIEPSKAKLYPDELLIKTYKRKANDQESGMMPPPVQQ
jgi:hypothetical protein